MAAPLIVGKLSSSGPLIFFLHGLGDTGHGLADVAKFFTERNPSQTWVLPTAPVRPVTINGGARMNAWYDIADLSHRNADSLDGFEEAVQSCVNLVNETKSPGRPVFLAGFSQGGAIAIAAAYSGQIDKNLSGLIALSTYCVQGVDSKCVSPAPLLMIHGQDDPMVSLEWGKKSFAMLKPHVRDAKFKEFPNLGHGIDMRVIHEMSEFLGEKSAQKSKM